MMNSKIINIADIKRQFDSKTFQRGYNYYTNKLVKGCQVVEIMHEKRSAIIFATVEGSSYYNQTIDISKGAINGRCTCPVAHNCKHVVAALFSAIHEEGLNDVEEKDPIDEWISQFKALQVKKVPTVIPQEDYFLIYRLFMEEYGDKKDKFDGNELVDLLSI